MAETQTAPPRHPSIAFLEECYKVLAELRVLIHDDVMRQAEIMPYPLKLRYGLRSLNQPLWEKLPEVMHLIQQDETLTDASKEYQMQFLLREVMCDMIRRCAGIPPTDTTAGTENVLASVITPTHFEQLAQLAAGTPVAQTNHASSATRDEDTHPQTPKR